MKILNHGASNIRHIARESVKLGVKAANEEEGFPGYELDNNNSLKETL